MIKLEKINKSDTDKLNYEAYKLENDLKVIFVEDKNTKKSCVVMNTNRGSYVDPKTHEGTAHLLEHMLFMGSEKYPDSDYYNKFINEHGGDCNAWTSSNDTLFYHTIINEVL